MKVLTRVWNQLKDSGIVSIEKGKIQSVVGYAGTRIGWEFARATKADASPFQAPPAMNPGYAAMDLAA